MTKTNGMLSVDEYRKLDAKIDHLRELSGEEAEETLGRILQPLLAQEGYKLRYTGRDGGGNIDFEARRDVEGVAESVPETLGIEAKFFSNRNPRRTVPAMDVRALIGTAVIRNIDRAILISNAEFSKQTRDEVARNLPVKIELLGVSELKSWAARLNDHAPSVDAEVHLILRDVSKSLAGLIAKSKSALAQLEWRDVERVMAEVFEGLGFGVTLTPGSKDGGKDIILTCSVRGKRSEYYVEVKHWRSSTRVGSGAVQKLLSVVVNEKKEGGLFLSTYGFTGNAFEQLTTVDKQKLRFGGEEKIAMLCQTYVRAQAGLWSPPSDLADVFWED